MLTCLNQSIKSMLFVSTFVVALMTLPITAHAGSRFRGAIDAGVAGAVAGDIAGQALLVLCRPEAIIRSPIRNQCQIARMNCSKSRVLTPTASARGAFAIDTMRSRSGVLLFAGSAEQVEPKTWALGGAYTQFYEPF